MFAVVRLFRKWFASLTGARVGLPTHPRYGDVFMRDSALRQAREVEAAYKQYAASEGLETIGETGSSPLEPVNGSFFHRQGEERF